MNFVRCSVVWVDLGKNSLQCYAQAEEPTEPKVSLETSSDQVGWSSFELEWRWVAGTDDSDFVLLFWQESDVREDLKYSD